ncbi:MAG: thioredoxin-dependent thiol peroxidase [Bacteroidota bacterium]|nr:thioredoxin-dependent thiol peroxidase [Bacteroidota bacterium]
MLMIQEGDRAPDFEGRNQDGEIIRLSDFAGQKLALYFYPKDNTPGCTKQACNLRDNVDELAQAGFAVVGVSPDSVESHERFAAKCALPFPLIADPEKIICNIYGVWGEKKMYGRTYFGIKRTTFVIDGAGRIEKVFRKPKTASHAEQILQAAAR